MAVALALVVVPMRPVLLQERAELVAARPSADIDGGAESELEAWPVDLAAGTEPAPPDRPPRPAKGQKRAPCDSRFEVEASGVCWLPVKAAPPSCPPQTVAFQGQCLLPLGRAQSPPVSVDAGTPSPPTPLGEGPSPR